MSEIKITIRVEACAMSLAHAAVDALDAKLRQYGGAVIRAKLVPQDGTKGKSESWAAASPSDRELHDGIVGAARDMGLEVVELKRWTVLYTRIPTSYHSQQKLIIEAATAEDARELARDHLGDRGKTLATYSIESVRPFVPLTVAGRVL